MRFRPTTRVALVLVAAIGGWMAASLWGEREGQHPPPVGPQHSATQPTRAPMSRPLHKPSTGSTTAPATAPATVDFAGKAVK